MIVNIIGKGEGWETAPPLSNKYETWGVNDLCIRRPVDLIFNMHDLSDKEILGIPLVSETIEFSNKEKKPFVTLAKMDSIPSSIRYPLEKMHTDYFTNSISYMIAYAIYKKATEINIYAVNMLHGGEYAYQKPNIEYWIGYARGLGLKVTANGITSILKSSNLKLYGYNTYQRT
jgi:hypothetical protein